MRSRLVLPLLAAAGVAGLAVAVTGLVLALHWHAQVVRLHRELRRATTVRIVSGPPPTGTFPVLTGVSRSWTAGRLTVTVSLVAARDLTTGWARIQVDGRITGGRPGGNYDLTAFDCTGQQPPIFSQARTDRAGRTRLTLTARAPAKDYWVVGLGGRGNGSVAVTLAGPLGKGKVLRASRRNIGCPH